MMKHDNNILEEADFLRTVDICKGIITKICYFYSNDSEGFQDLRQDVLAAMWYSRTSFRGNANVSTWVYRIALNTCVSSMRKHKKGGQRVELEKLP